MDILYATQDNLLRHTQTSFIRSLAASINWNNRMTGIKGPRGAGKTTLLLQHIKTNNLFGKALYTSADHFWYYTHSLFETADTFYKNGGNILMIDEVHKYPNWSAELKNIYDSFPDMKVIFTSSSALDIYRGEADLSRRVIMHELPGLSFREFLLLKEGKDIQQFTFEDILKDHRQAANAVMEKIKPIPLFNQYLQFGYLPIFTEGAPGDVPVKLNQVINTVLDMDLAYIKDYNAGTAYKVKKLLGVIAESAPFKPNISALADKLSSGRDSIYQWMIHLEKARLLNLLRAEGKGVSTLQKPDKLYLENTNLAYALKNNPDRGSLRETFLLNQLRNSGMETSLPSKGDFLVRGVVIETGGKGKNASQVKKTKQYCIAADDIEIGIGNKIPLWMFGMMY